MVETPLFEGMLVPQQAVNDIDDVANDNVADDVANVEPTPPSPPPTITPPPSQELPSTSHENPTKQGEIIAKIDADKDVSLEEVDAAKDNEVEKNKDVQGRLEESQA
nr:hypothetical protein [Tanacetum cinerariifolium]